MLKPDIFAWQKTGHFCLALTTPFDYLTFFRIVIKVLLLFLKAL
jgi:hypothetical protein